MREISYVVRHSRGKSWAVDKWEYYGVYKIKENTWYFPTEQEANDFKQRSEEQ